MEEAAEEGEEKEKEEEKKKKASKKKEEESLDLENYEEVSGKDAAARARRLAQENKIQEFFDRVKKNLGQE